MEEFGPGLYEALITDGLKVRLDALADRLPTRVRDLRVEVGLSIARALLDRLGEMVTIRPGGPPG